MDFPGGDAQHTSHLQLLLAALAWPDNSLNEAHTALSEEAERRERKEKRREEDGDGDGYLSIRDD
jgi:hypothetical protein